MPSSPLTRYLVLQQALDADVTSHLLHASSQIDLELGKLQQVSRRSAGIGNLVRTEQLQRAQAAIARELHTLWTKVGDTTGAAMALARAEAAESILAGSESVLGKLFSEADRAYMMESVKTQAARGSELLRERVSGTSRIDLSARVYRAEALTRGTVEQLINSALARGASAAELAKDVRRYINPNTAGGVKYAAMRLARTELNNAFHAQQIRQAEESPFVDGIKWNLSGSHPVPDECNDYAEKQHVKGQDVGFFKPNEVPVKPHPNCLCYLTPVTIGEEEFIQSFLDGQYDAYLKKNFPEMPSWVPPVNPNIPAPPGWDKPWTPSTPIPSPTQPKAAPKPRPASKATNDSPMVPDRDHFSGEFDRITPEPYTTAYTKVNETILGQEYQNNCHYVVQAMEMRARGFDVVADRTFKDNGRWMQQSMLDWVDPATGEPRSFKFVRPKADGYVNITKIQEATEDWPPGSRGVIRGSWRRGGGHIWNVYKDEKGKIKLIDGQVKEKNASAYLDKMKDVWVMRVDDLEPNVERLGRAIQKKSQATRVVAGSPAEIKKLEEFIADLEETIAFAGSRAFQAMHDLLKDLRAQLASSRTS